MDKSILIDEILRKLTLQSPSGIIDINKLSIIEAVTSSKSISTPIPTDIESLKNELILFINKFIEWEESFSKLNNDPNEGAHLKESWPLYYTFKENGNDYYPKSKEMIDKWYALIKNNNSIINQILKFDSDKIKKYFDKSLYTWVVEFLERFKYIQNITGESNEAELKKIFPSLQPTGFIHASISDVYTVIKKLEKTKGKSKNPTFDIVLLYGGLSPETLYKCIPTSKANVNENCLIDANDSNNSLKGQFALVSLKVGDARIGGAKKAFVNIFDDYDEKQKEKDDIARKTMNESIISNIASSINKFYKDVTDGTQKLFDSIKSSWENFKNNILKFSKNVERAFSLGYKFYEDADKSYPELMDLVNDINTLNESSGHCGDEYIYDPKKKFRNNFQTYIKLCKTDINTAVQNYNNILSKESKLRNIGIILNIMELKSFLEIAKTYSIKISEVYERIKDTECIPRSEVYFITAFAANIKSIEIINKLIMIMFNDASNVDEIRKNYLDIAKVLSSASIYGSMETFPLIKIEKGVIKKLGNKNEYETTTFLKDIDPNWNLGLLRIQKSSVKEHSHLIIVFDIFFGIQQDDDVLVPMYAEIELRRDRESGFLNKIEMAHVKTKEQVFGI